MKHMTRLKNGRRGQALLLVTLSLFAMCGLLGLAVDLGWSYFVKKSAQNAADSAALADAYQALSAVGQTASFSGYSDNASVALGYAKQNLFLPGGNGGRQNVTITPNLGSQQLIRQDLTFVTPCALPAPLVGCFEYAATVRTSETIPQLFSAVLGNAAALSSARATAAVVQTRVNGSIITLDRTADAGPSPTGMNITAPSGFVVASNLAGISLINGPIIAMSPLANPGVGGSNTFQNMADGPQFLDPLRGYGQPPLPPLPKLPAHQCILADSGPECVYAVDRGVLSGIICYKETTVSPGGQNVVLPSGTYYPTQLSAKQCSTPDKQPQSGGLRIADGATVTFANGAFGSFLFFGGLTVNGQMKMDPGEYVVVGGQPQSQGSLQVNGSNASITNNGNAGAGEIIILTGSSSDFTLNSDGSAITGNVSGDLYPGLMALINGPTNSNLDLVAMAQRGMLAFWPANIQTTFGNVPSADPSGLNPIILSSLSTPYPANLQPFGGIVLWQDQANSTVQYAADGNVALCGGGINNPCPRTPTTPTSPLLILPGTALGLNGTIYQPRGAWINVSSGSGLTGTLQIITGAVTGGTINISPPTTPVPLRRRVVALIE